MPDLPEQEQRMVIARAAWRVIETEGIPATSMRTIARAMGATTGLVTRYFASKQALLCFSVQAAGATLSDRAARPGEARGGLAAVAATLDAVLPHDMEGQTAWAVWVAALGFAGGSPELAAAHAEFPDGLRRRLIQGLRDAQRAGEVAAHLYPANEADLLLAQTIGTVVQAIRDPARNSPEKLRAVLGVALQRLGNA